MDDRHKTTCNSSGKASIQSVLGAFERIWAHRYPKVRMSFAQVDAGLLPDTMCSVYHGQNAPLTTESDHFFPRKINARDGGDGIDDGDNLQLRSVADFVLRYLQFCFQSIEMRTESLQGRCACCGELQFENRERRVRWRISDVLQRPFHRTIGRRCCGSSEKLRCKLVDRKVVTYLR
jgi:hypothetical protein